jgi:hypothetical protein
LRIAEKCGEENRDERERVEGWVIEQWWGGRESDGLLLQRERTLRKDKANGEAEWQQQQTGWAEQDGIEKMYGAGAMWEQSQRVWE